MCIKQRNNCVGENDSWVGHIARVEEIENACKMAVGICERSKTFGNFSNRVRIILKSFLEEIRCEAVN